jgi:alpha-tubulin suppressor-like RCC1 family protein
VNKNVTDICKICIGHTFVLVLTRAGRVWSCGEGAQGQLGHHSSSYEQPQRLKNLIQFKMIEFEVAFKDVSCGYYHALALSYDGQVYGWGNNQHGQLGVTDKKMRPTPTLLTTILDEHIRAVHCGGFFNILVSAMGELYAFGTNSYGELGTGSLTNPTLTTPTKIGGGGGLLNNEDIRFVAVGYYHVLALPETRKNAILNNTLHAMKWYESVSEDGRVACLITNGIPYIPVENVNGESVLEHRHCVRVYEYEGSGQRLFPESDYVVEKLPVAITHRLKVYISWV